MFTIKNHKTTFIKPEFESLVSNNIPTTLKYKESIITLDEGYSFYISPNPTTKNDYLIVNFVSLETNDVWIKIRVLKNNNVVAESGLIKPGEYFEKIKLSNEIDYNDELTYIIMGYEKETYLSAGAANLKIVVGD